MSNSQLKIQKRNAQLHSAVSYPDLRSQRVICDSPFDYCSLWLKRKKQQDALFYWEQAKHFYAASKLLPDTSAPLTSYYCFLNAVKALLVARGHEFTDQHGVTGWFRGVTTSLDNEKVLIKGGGILPAFVHCLGEKIPNKKPLTLKQILWHMPFLHRAYCLSYKATELFIPLQNPRFLRKDGSKEAWFEADIEQRYINSHTANLTRPGFALNRFGGSDVVRRKRKFKWSGKNIESSIHEFTKYHRSIRTRIVPIYTMENRWYLKKSVVGHDEIINSQLILMFAVMHRLSELSRYDPIKLQKHFNVSHNWLLSEFIKLAPEQFIYGIASELTGMEFVKPTPTSNS